MPNSPIPVVIVEKVWILPSTALPALTTPPVNIVFQRCELAYFLSDSGGHSLGSNTVMVTEPLTEQVPLVAIAVKV